MIAIKLIIVIIVIIIFFVVVSKQVEKFSDIKSYVNTNKMPIDYFKINSSLPYDIKSKNENSLIYDYGNDELDEKFIVVFNIQLEKQINLIEGIEWSNWRTVTDLNYDTLLATYYNNTIVHFKNKLNEDCFKLPTTTTNFKILHQTLNRYKISKNNKNIYLLDIDFLIYREKKPLARHVKAIVVCNNNYTSFLMVKVIGVVNESALHNNNLISATDNDVYAEFMPEREIIYDPNDYIYDFNDKREKSQIAYNLYNKLLKDLN